MATRSLKKGREALWSVEVAEQQLSKSVAESDWVLASDEAPPKTFPRAATNRALADLVSQ